MSQGGARRRVVWNRSGNPVAHVSRVLRLSEERVGAAIHAIKAAAGLRGADAVIIYDNGDVTSVGGDEIGNIHDED